MSKKYKETRLRTIVKSLILRIIVFLIITLFVILILNGSIKEGIEVAFLDIGVELVTYYIYDRIWQKINWGIVEKEPNDPAKTYRNIKGPEISAISEISDISEEENKQIAFTI
jgi:uncharacterized membrane protein